MTVMASPAGRVRAVRGVDLGILSASLRKLGARNRPEAVDLATETGWL
jgi:hypothetical protein